MRKLILVYHEPGKPEGYKLMESFAENLSRTLEMPVKPVPLKKYLSGEEKPGKRDCVAAMLLTRGGHYYSVLSKTKTYGARFLGKIPLDLVLERLGRVLEGMFCHRVVIVYRKAKNYVEEQEEDMERVIVWLAYQLETPVLCVSCGKVELFQYDCVVSFTLLPSRLIEEKVIGKPEPFRTLEYLLPVLSDNLYRWISGSLQSECK